MLELINIVTELVQRTGNHRTTGEYHHTLAGTAACEEGGRVHGSKANTTGIFTTRCLHYF